MNIGVTGHQDLTGKKVVKWLRDEITTIIKNTTCIRIANSSLAIGADQLFANIIIDFGIDLKAIIPCEGYEQTFSGVYQRNIYTNLLSKCKTTETLEFVGPSEEAFFSAGKRVVDESDILFAIWDGHQAKGLGGTGDVVNYALLKKKKVIHLNPVSRTKNIHN